MACGETFEKYFDPRAILPVLVAEKIASYLNGPDLISLGMTCKFWREIAAKNAVWKVLAEKRFGKTSIDSTNENYKKLYFDLGRTKMPVADFYRLVHLGERYLRKIDEPESIFDSVIYLNTVCWLQLDGKFCGVFPGKYHVLWRMKLEDAYMHNNSGEPCIWYKATPAEGCGAQLSYKWNVDKMEQAEKQNGKNCWFVHDMGELIVESMCDVHVEITGRNGWWCGGFYWDYVQLKRGPVLESKKKVWIAKGTCSIS